MTLISNNVFGSRNEYEGEWIDKFKNMESWLWCYLD